MKANAGAPALLRQLDIHKIIVSETHTLSYRFRAFVLCSTALVLVDFYVYLYVIIEKRELLQPTQGGETNVLSSVYRIGCSRQSGFLLLLLFFRRPNSVQLRSIFWIGSANTSSCKNYASVQEIEHSFFKHPCASYSREHSVLFSGVSHFHR